MPNLAAVLKEEIRRLARKEIRPEVAALRKTMAQQRREIASLKKALLAQARQTATVARVAKKGTGAGPAPAATTTRFSPKWLAAHRAKLEISAADYAALVGVSMLTIYNWEKGKTKPRPQQLEAWSNMRTLGKREAWKKLEEMGR